jgi:hypothetical protein
MVRLVSCQRMQAGSNRWIRERERESGREITNEERKVERKKEGYITERIRTAGKGSFSLAGASRREETGKRGAACSFPPRTGAVKPLLLLLMLLLLLSFLLWTLSGDSEEEEEEEEEGLPPLPPDTASAGRHRRENVSAPMRTDSNDEESVRHISSGPEPVLLLLLYCDPCSDNPSGAQKHPSRLRARRRARVAAVAPLPSPLSMTCALRPCSSRVLRDGPAPAAAVLCDCREGEEEEAEYRHTSKSDLTLPLLLLLLPFPSPATPRAVAADDDAVPPAPAPAATEAPLVPPNFVHVITPRPRAVEIIMLLLLPLLLPLPLPLLFLLPLTPVATDLVVQPELNALSSCCCSPAKLASSTLPPPLGSWWPTEVSQN